ncbi:MAG: hypothetical protein P9L97_03980 [Candidatus Tenebribacter davisii]|nr:hypothetical protein [Candidatus Tenebribacter davisii]
MKYLIFVFIILTGIILTSCGLEGNYYIEAHEYPTLINCDGSDKIHLFEGYAGKVSFYDNDQKILYASGDDIISFDLSSLQSEIFFSPEPDIWYMNGYELFHELQKVIYWEGTTDWDILVATIETGEIEYLTNTIDIREEKVKLSSTEEYFVYIEKDYTYVDSVLWSIKYRNFDGSINETVISKFQGIGPGEFRYVDWIDSDTLIYSDNDAGINPGIYLINIDGTNKQHIFEGLYLRFSICEDRTKVVFEDEDEIYLIDTTDYSVTHLVSGVEPVISPDGNKLAYMDEIRDLIVWDLVEDTTTLLSEDPDSPISIIFSTDNQKLIFNERIVETHYRDKRIMY